MTDAQDVSFAYNVYRAKRAEVLAELIARFRLQPGMLVTNGKRLYRIVEIGSSDVVPLDINVVKGERLLWSGNPTGFQTLHQLYELETWQPLDCPLPSEVE